jgi:adenine-specific DNA-methyltransferase
VAIPWLLMPEARQTLRFKTLPGLVRAFRRWADESEVLATPDVPGASEGERRVLGALGGVAAAVAGDHVARWPDALQRWAGSAAQPPDVILEAVLEDLGARVDPLTALYDASISAAHRRRLGTVFTPAPLVDHMLDLADDALECPPVCVLDPGAGVGAFTIAAARRWPLAHVVAIDVNVVTLGLLAARIAFEIDAEPDDAACLSRIEVVLDDYLDQLEERFATAAPTPVLALGNPPYTRIQELPHEYRRKAASFGGEMIDSGHANLAVLFQAATLNHMRADDLSCLVLPGSVGYTRASRGLRGALWHSSRPVRMHRTPATTRPFTGRSVQAAVLVVGPEEKQRSPVQLARVQINGDSAVVLEEWERVRGEDEPGNWFWTTQSEPSGATVALADIARVRRGVATGANAMFFLSDAEAARLPKEVITPAVPTLRRFTHDDLDENTHVTWGNGRARRWLLAIPPDLRIRGELRSYIERYEEEVSHRFLPSQRRPWYSITDLHRPQLLVSPLSKSQFKVVLNSVRAVPSNNLLGITMNNGTGPLDLAEWLRSGDGQRELRRVSRRYHGGSHKLEPGDLKQLRVPAGLCGPCS